MEKIFITLGLGNKFDKDKFQPIRNVPNWCKPKGGLWSSPVDSEYGWTDFCRCEAFYRGIDGTKFRFRLKNSARVYTIDSLQDLLNVPYTIKIMDIYSIFGDRLIDFEKMAENYDAIYLTLRGEEETRHSEFDGMALSCWDVETLLVLNPEVVEEV